MILVDTNVLVAAAVRGDSNHQVATTLLRNVVGPLGVLPTVVAETCYLMERMIGPGADAAFLSDIANGHLQDVGLIRPDFARMAELVTQYDDQPLGGTDASIVAVAERLGVTTIATMDNHFRIVVPRHVSAFVLLP